MRTAFFMLLAMIITVSLIYSTFSDTYFKLHPHGLLSHTIHNIELLDYNTNIPLLYVHADDNIDNIYVQYKVNDIQYTKQLKPHLHYKQQRRAIYSIPLHNIANQQEIVYSLVYHNKHNDKVEQTNDYKYLHIYKDHNHHKFEFDIGQLSNCKHQQHNNSTICQIWYVANYVTLYTIHTI